MKRSIALLLVSLLLAGPGLGCGRNVEKGVNKDRDRPKPSEKEG